MLLDFYHVGVWILDKFQLNGIGNDLWNLILWLHLLWSGTVSFFSSQCSQWCHSSLVRYVFDLYDGGSELMGALYFSKIVLLILLENGIYIAGSHTKYLPNFNIYISRFMESVGSYVWKKLLINVMVLFQLYLWLWLAESWEFGHVAGFLQSTLYHLVWVRLQWWTDTYSQSETC